MPRPGLQALCRATSWDPSKAANAGDLFTWGQVSFFGSDMAVTSNKPHRITNRLGGTNGVQRTDNDPSGMPGFKARGRTIARPVLDFPGTAVYGFCSAGVEITMTAASWTFGARISIASGTRCFYGFNYPDNAGLFVTVGASGVTFDDGHGHTVTCPKTILANVAYSIVVTVSGSSITLTVCTAGQSDAVTATGTAANAPLAGSYQLLGSNSSFSSVFVGELAEWVLFLSACNTSDHNALVRLLAAGSYPLTTSGTTIGFEFGNSNGTGVGASVDELTAVANDLTTPIIHSNHSVSGRSLAAMDSGFASDEDLAITSSTACGSKVFVIVQELINMLANVGSARGTTANPQNAQDVFDTLVSYVNKLVAIDPNNIVIVSNAYGRVVEGGGYLDLTGGYQTDFVTLNALIAAHTWPANVHVIDAGGDPGIGPTPPYVGDTYRLGEGTAPNRLSVHRTNAGQARDVALIKVPLALHGIT